MICVKGTFPAKKAVELTQKKLDKKVCVIAGNAHGLHLSDILYKRHSKEDKQDGYKKKIDK